MLILKECHSGVLGCEIKHCKQLEAGEKTQKLRVLAAFKEVQSSVPSTHSRKLTTPVALAPRDSMHSSDLCCQLHTYTCEYTQTQGKIK